MLYDYRSPLGLEGPSLMTNQTRLLELALKGLESERGQIDEEIADIQSRIRSNGAVSTQSAPLAQPASRRRRGRLTAEGRKKISEMMTARWAARRKAMQAVASARPSKRRGLTAAGRKALSEAMKRRWAERRKAMAKSAK